MTGITEFLDLEYRLSHHSQWIMRPILQQAMITPTDEISNLKKLDKSNTKIMCDCDILESSVKTYLRVILKKLNVFSRTKASR